METSSHLFPSMTTIVLLLVVGSSRHGGGVQGSNYELCSPREIQRAMTQVCAMHRRSVRLVNTNGPSRRNHYILPDGIDYEHISNYGMRRRTKRSVNGGEFRKHRRDVSGDGFRRTKRNVVCPYGRPCVDSVKYSQSDLISKQEFELSLRRQMSGSRDLRDNSWMVKYLENDKVYEDVQLHSADQYIHESVANPWLLQHGDVRKNRILKNSYIRKYSDNVQVIEQQQQPRYPTNFVVDHTRPNQQPISMYSAGPILSPPPPPPPPPPRDVWSSSAVGPPPPQVLSSRSARGSSSSRILRQPLQQEHHLGVLRVHKRDGDGGSHGHRTLRDVWMQCCLEGCTLADWVGGCM